MTKLVGCALLLLLLTPAFSQNTEPEALPKGYILLTIFLRHDETKTLDQINQHLAQTGFNKNFPPAGVDVVSWYVMMGVGQVVTLRVPPEKVREVNLAIERGAWGAFKTDLYLTYDYKPVWEASKNQK